VFELIRSWRHDRAAVLCVFDVLELDGEDLRRLAVEERKRALAQLLRGPAPGMVLNEHYFGDGALVFAQACKLVDRI
jgi:ATP-dependent DNA ligase